MKWRRSETRKEKRTKSTNERTNEQSKKRKKEKLESDLNSFLVQILRQSHTRWAKAHAFQTCASEKKQKREVMPDGKKRVWTKMNKNWNRRQIAHSHTATAQWFSEILSVSERERERVQCDYYCCLSIFLLLHSMDRWSPCARTIALCVRDMIGPEKGEQKKVSLFFLNTMQNQNV